MGKLEEPLPARLVCGILYREEPHFEMILGELASEFGPSDFRSDPILFEYTNYYFSEMGRPLYRRFVSFERLMDCSQLSRVKVFTNSLEDRHAVEGKRILNVDPGYLTAASYVLATSKNYAHRIYLGNGVFAQQELLFHKKRIQTLDWTYPDYRTFEYQEIFRRIHAMYMKQLKFPEH
jgi:hypothetical protein